MELLQTAVDLVLHADRHLPVWIDYFGAWIYVVLFAIVFCETGLVVTPILPGDSLLFAVGALAATGALDLPTVLVLLVVAAIAGDAVNYSCGHYLGPKVLTGDERRWLKREYLDRTHRFFERHGGKTIILARFVPIVRTFAPFVAGVGAMSYPRFFLYNVTGAMLWVALFVGGGYAFGNLPFVKRNFSLVILAIIVVSVLPIAVEWLRARRARPLVDAPAPID